MRGCGDFEDEEEKRTSSILFPSFFSSSSFFSLSTSPWSSRSEFLGVAGDFLDDVPPGALGTSGVPGVLGVPDVLGVPCREADR